MFEKLKLIVLDKEFRTKTITVGSIKKIVKEEVYVNQFAMQKYFSHKDQTKLTIHLLKQRKELVALDFDKLHRNLNFLEFHYALNLKTEPKIKRKIMSLKNFNVERRLD